MGLESVSVAVDADEVPRGASGLAELLAESGDQDVERRDVDGPLGLPDGAEELASAEGLAWAGHQDR